MSGAAVLDTNPFATDPDYQQAVDVELPPQSPAMARQPQPVTRRGSHDNFNLTLGVFRTLLVAQ